MASMRSQIFAAALVALNTDRPAGIPVAERDRLEPTRGMPFTNLVIPSFGARHAQESITKATANQNSPVLVRRVLLGVGSYNEGATIDCLDAQMCWATACLDGSTLGGLVRDIQEHSIFWEEASSNLPYRMAIQVFEVLYNTKRGDQEQRS